MVRGAKQGAPAEGEYAPRCESGGRENNMGQGGKQGAPALSRRGVCTALRGPGGEGGVRSSASGEGKFLPEWQARGREVGKVVDLCSAVMVNKNT